MALSALTFDHFGPTGGALDIGALPSRGLRIFSPLGQPANRIPNLAPMRARTIATDGTFVGSLAPGVGRFGRQLALTNANYATYTNPGISTSYSFLYAFYMPSMPSAVGASNFILGPFSQGADYDWGLYASFSTDKLVYYPTRQADTPAAITAAAAVSTFRPYVVIGSFNSVTGVAELTIDGVSQGTADNSGKAAGTANTLYLGFDWASTGLGMPTNGLLFALWDRAIPSFEAAQISRDVWASFNPPRRRLVANSVAGGGGPSATGAAMHHHLQTMGAR